MLTRPTSEPTVTPLDGEAAVGRAREIIAREVEGLTELARSLDGSVAAAAALIAGGAGRLIVTGIGKSGHIGAKLAATFASTGTPAFFLHAAEAAHGDLGMITRSDMVLAISNSGNSRELYAVLDYCEANSIAVLGITANPASRLGRQAAVVLTLPEVDEVCPNNLAPTTSAILTLSLGHVLAVLLMEMRAFAEADFAQLHPGGRLGLLLSKVGRYVEEYCEAIPTVAPEAALGEVIDVVTAGRKGCAVVVGPDGGALQGMITEGDLRRAYAPDMFAKNASEIMSPRPVIVGLDALVKDAVVLMKERRIAAIIAVDAANRPAGLLDMKDLMARGYV
jgi:arabinose-5-phosphate isomerase